MRDILSHLTESKRLEKEQLACMYAKDLAVVRQHDIEDDEAIQQIINEPPNEEEIEELVTRREEMQRF